MKSSGERTHVGSETPQTVTVSSLLVSWANDQDPRVRQLVSEVIVDGKGMIPIQAGPVSPHLQRLPGHPTQNQVAEMLASAFFSVCNVRKAVVPG
jgi:hypothetical protein